MRDKNEPWGCEWLHAQERDQVYMGNVLLRVVIDFMADAAIIGIPASMEHPATPRRRATCASTWRLPETLALLDFKQAHTISLDQCMFGALSKKPTTFLCVHIQQARGMLQNAPGSGRCTRRGLHRAALGRDDTSGFRTKPLKEHPPRMYEVFAKLCISAWGMILAPGPTPGYVHCQIARFY